MTYSFSNVPISVALLYQDILAQNMFSTIKRAMSPIHVLIHVQTGSKSPSLILNRLPNTMMDSLNQSAWLIAGDWLEIPSTVLLGPSDDCGSPQTDEPGSEEQPESLLLDLCSPDNG